MTTTSVTKKVTRPKTKEASIELPANPFAFEVLNLISKLSSDDKKVEVLQKYKDASLKSILIWNFDDSIVSNLPEGIVPYSNVGQQNSFSGTLTGKIDDAVFKMSELGSNSLGSQDQGFSTIRKEHIRFYNFVKGGNHKLSSMRRETMFINILEGLHPLEAEILCLTKDKKLQTKYKITKENVSNAYPEILWGGRS